MKFDNITFFGNWMETIFNYRLNGYHRESNILWNAIADYIYFGTEPDFKEMHLQNVWANIKPGMESQRKSIGKSHTARRNGEKGGRRKKTATAPEPETSTPEQPQYQDTILEILERQENERHTATPSTPPTATHGHRATSTPSERWRPPTREEVREKAKELGLTHVDPEVFYLHYEGEGWKVNGKPLINWHSKMQRWDADEKKKNPQPKQPPQRTATAKPSTPPPPQKELGTNGKWHFEFMTPEIYRFGEAHGIKQIDLDKFIGFLKNCYIEYSPTLDDKTFYDQHGNVVEDWQPLCLEYTKNLGG